MEQKVKFRHELKYLCSSAELEMLRIRLATIMKPDPNTDALGWYHIRSIYFDDYYNTSVKENEDGSSPREKWRIRSYNNNPNRISLECKRKENGKIRKTSCLLNKNQFQALVDGKSISVDLEKSSPVLNRFKILQQEKGLMPKVIVGYDRRPYVYKNGNVRVTFDCNIFSSPDIEAFFDNKIKRRPIMLSGRELLEVKYDEYIPDFIYRAIQMQNMQQITFSKYYLCRRYEL